MTATIPGPTAAEFSSPEPYDFGSVLLGGNGNRDYISRDHFTNHEARGGGIHGWAVRKSNYRFVVQRDAPGEFFDLTPDPLEQLNLLAGGRTDEVLRIEADLHPRRDALIAKKE
ncbi:MAG: hypothetical protein AAF871_09445 [Pseudomonadota bacterium]